MLVEIIQGMNSGYRSTSTTRSNNWAGVYFSSARWLRHNSVTESDDPRVAETLSLRQFAPLVKGAYTATPWYARSSPRSGHATDGHFVQCTISRDSDLTSETPGEQDASSHETNADRFALGLRIFLWRPRAEIGPRITRRWGRSSLYIAASAVSPFAA